MRAGADVSRRGAVDGAIPHGEGGVAAAVVKDRNEALAWLGAGRKGKARVQELAASGRTFESIGDEWIAGVAGELDLAGLDQLEDRHCGEHLVHRPDAKSRPKGVPDRSLAVSQPVRVTEEHPAVPGDQNRARELILARKPVDADRDRPQSVRFRVPHRNLRLVAASGEQQTKCGRNDERARKGPR